MPEREAGLHYIDTHCHIIPGVDDGPRDEQASVEMARIAEADGIGTIIATPHIVEGLYDGSDRTARLESLRATLAKNGIELDIIAGAEVPMSACIAGDREYLAGLALAGGRYLLVETADTTFDQLSRAVYQVRLTGLFPVLAHPERTSFVQHEPERLRQTLNNTDVFCQITASSLEGLFGKTVQKTSISLIRAGLVHLVATDAHSAGKRKPVLSESHRMLVDIAGEAAARTIMFENPRRVIDGELMAGIPAENREASRLRIFSRFRRR